MARGDLTRPTDATIKRLFARSGNRCAFPRCAVQIVQGDTLVGEMCHIKAARPGGPRYDPHQTAAERHGYNNLILMCGSHHTVIDDDEEAYTVEHLIRMKTDHEQTATPLPHDRAASGTQLLIDQCVRVANQSGGITAHTINIYAAQPSRAPIESSAPEPEPFPEASPSYNRAVYFQPNEILATVGYPGEQEYRVKGEKLVYLRLFPTYSGQIPVGLAKLTRVFETRRPCPMSMTIGGVTGRNHWGPIIYDPDVSPTTIVGLTQGFASGELWGLNAQQFSLRGRHNVSGAELWVTAAIGVEKPYVRALRNYVRVASSELHLTLPYTVELGAVGIDGLYLLVPGGPLNNGQFVGPIMKRYIQKRFSLSELSDDANQAITPVIFYGIL